MLLQVDALAGRFGGNKKAYISPIEPRCGEMSILSKVYYLAVGILHTLDETIFA